MEATEAQLAEGRRALRDGSWERARSAFGAVTERETTGEALEGLGWAHWWLDDIEASFEVRERAYRAHLDAGDPRAAARVATSLAVDAWDFHGPAVANGWMQRARRHLDGLDTGPEHGWLALWEGHLARHAGADPESVRALAAEAGAVARACGVPDLELLAIGLEGHALVAAGDVEAGMRRLDEATAAALAGEISELDTAQQVCCLLLHACEQVRDYERALQWTERASQFARRWRIRPLHAICRTHYAAVLVGRGDWAEADAELQAILNEVRRAQQQARLEALLHLGELRRRQGRFEEAEELYAEVEGWSLALAGRAAIALDEGRPEAAIPLLERGLRRAAADNWTVRTSALALLVEARLRAGELAAARRSCGELGAIAERVGSSYARASARRAAGLLAEEGGAVEEARQAFEDAVDFFERSPAPYEAARSRLLLSRVLDRLGRAEAARGEEQRARLALERLGGERLLRRFAGAAAATAAGVAPPPAPLTAREAEVLRHVAEGMSDKEIAERLSLSEHTVHRHVSNILNRLGLSSRAAAVAVAVRRGII